MRILTFPDPPAHSVKSLLSQMFCTGVPNIELQILRSSRSYWGHFRPSKSVLALFSLLHGEVVFVATAVQILEILLLGHFIQMFCMKCVPYIVLHNLCSTRTYWVHFRLSEVSFWSFWANKANIPPFPHF